MEAVNNKMLAARKGIVFRAHKQSPRKVAVRAEFMLMAGKGRNARHAKSKYLYAREQSFHMSHYDVLFFCHSFVFMIQLLNPL